MLIIFDKCYKNKKNMVNNKKIFQHFFYSGVTHNNKHQIYVFRFVRHLRTSHNDARRNFVRRADGFCRLTITLTLKMY